MRTLIIVTLLVVGLTDYAQPILILKKQRPPELDVSTYKQIAVGDIVGAIGSKNEQSLDLTDALTARLFNAKTLEVIDRNALETIFGSQRRGDLQVIDEKTKQLLNSKLSHAILISGRIQSQQLEQKLIYSDQNIVLNGCNRTYYYEVKGNVTVQLKILDLKTGRMIFSDAVVKPVEKKTKEECQIPEKMDMAQVTRNAIGDLSDNIAKLVVPFETSTTLQFSEPGFFKSPFKKLKEAVSFLSMNNYDAGLAILKEYTESKDIKEKVRVNAWFNYGLGLLYANKNAEAKTALQKAAASNPNYTAFVADVVKMIDDEEETAKRTQAIAAARLKKQSEDVAEEQAASPQPKKAVKPAAKSAVKPKAKN